MCCGPYRNIDTGVCLIPGVHPHAARQSGCKACISLFAEKLPILDLLAHRGMYIQYLKCMYIQRATIKTKFSILDRFKKFQGYSTAAGLTRVEAHRARMRSMVQGIPVLGYFF